MASCADIVKLRGQVKTVVFGTAPGAGRHSFGHGFFAVSAQVTCIQRFAVFLLKDLPSHLHPVRSRAVGRDGRPGRLERDLVQQPRRQRCMQRNHLMEQKRHHALQRPECHHRNCQGRCRQFRYRHPDGHLHPAGHNSANSRVCHTNGRIDLFDR